MRQPARRERIASLLEKTGEVTIADLARGLSVSEMTVRRDLDALAAEGRAIRTHGGACAAARVSFEFAFLRQKRTFQKEKEEIGRLAAKQVGDGQSVILDSGTTTLAVARALRGRADLTVVTTSLPIASELQYQSAIRVLLLGGYLRTGSPDLSGGLTERNLDELRADVAILGADAVGLDGAVYSASPDVAHMLAGMARAATSVYVVVDHSKVGRQALMRYGSVAEWAGIITDSAIDKAAVASLQNAGVTVIR